MKRCFLVLLGMCPFTYLSSALDENGLVVTEPNEFVDKYIEGIGVYRGYMTEDYFDGYGELQGDDGTNYRGQWVLNFPHGEGEAWSDNGCYRLVGEFYNGAPEGRGTLTIEERFSITTEFLHGQPRKELEGTCDCNGDIYECTLKEFDSECLAVAVQNGQISEQCRVYFYQLTAPLRN